MPSLRRRRPRGVVTATTLALLLAACGSGDSGSASDDADEDTATSTAADSGDEDGAGGTVVGGDGEGTEIRWFVGLGAGGQPEQIEAQERVVEAFNSSQSDVNLVLEIVENDVAYDTLSTQVASGNPPDIVGPVGRDGSNSYAGQYLDLEPLIESTGYDTSRWPEETIESFREEDGTLQGLPFASFPSFVYVNTDLFDEAGLPYPPQEYGPDGVATYGEGTEYEGTWDFDKVAEIGAFLTVDSAGVDATQDGFDRTDTVQWGYVQQWTTLPFAIGTNFGAGSPVADDGSAAIPAQWVDAWAWYHDAVHEIGMSPTQEENDSELLGGNAFSSGNVAMAHSHLWYTCCVRDADGNGQPWMDLAVMPSHEGTVTAQQDNDTFRILSATEHPDEAFEVLTYLLGDAALELLNAYGAAPADPELTDAFYEGLDEAYPQGVAWEVARASNDHVDIPNHEQATPAWEEYKLAMGDFESALLSDPEMDVAARAEQLEGELSDLFAGADG